MNFMKSSLNSGNVPGRKTPEAAAGEVWRASIKHPEGFQRPKPAAGENGNVPFWVEFPLGSIYTAGASPCSTTRLVDQSRT